jgi:hypothetical protein
MVALAATTVPTFELFVTDTLQKLEAGIIKIAPLAWQSAITIKRIDSIQNLIIGFILLILSLVGLKLLKQIYKIAKETDYDTYDLPGWIFGAVFGTIAYIILLIFTLTQLLDIWTWMGLFDPRIAVIHDIYLKVVSVIK